MPDYRSMYDALYLSAYELQGRDITVTIAKVTAGALHKQGGKDDGGKPKTERKPILHFVGKSKGLVLCKTNAKLVVGMYGKMTEDWVGKRITMFPTTTKFGRDIVECIRLRPRIPGAATKDAPRDPEPPQDEREMTTDDIGEPGGQQ